MDDEAAGLSNIAAVPGTRLLFDRRSLLARKPSVRFRNTGDRAERQELPALNQTLYRVPCWCG